MAPAAFKDATQSLTRFG